MSKRPFVSPVQPIRSYNVRDRSRVTDRLEPGRNNLFYRLMSFVISRPDRGRVNREYSFSIVNHGSIREWNGRYNFDFFLDS